MAQCVKRKKDAVLSGRSEVQLVSEKVCEIMENVVEFDIVMKAEAAVADNWSEAH